MFSEEIKLDGHIIDSLVLPKVLDEILSRGGNFKILEMRVGEKRTDPSHARIQVSGPSPEALDDLVKHWRQHGAELISESDAQLAEAPADGVFPEDFYVTTNQPTYVRVGGKWIEVKPTIMDSGIAVDESKLEATAVKFYSVRQGMTCVVGHGGIRVMPLERSTHGSSVFEFMASNVSIEKPKTVIIRELAEEFHRTKTRGGKILVVAGPALVHTGAGEHFEKLIEWGYVPAGHGFQR
jgi:lysine-ketoglutarate reductase/saccharopine dehydrogenase-like protein (TIGR00300 family)